MYLEGKFLFKFNMKGKTIDSNRFSWFKLTTSHNFQQFLKLHWKYLSYKKDPFKSMSKQKARIASYIWDYWDMFYKKSCSNSVLKISKILNYPFGKHITFSYLILLFLGRSKRQLSLLSMILLSSFFLIPWRYIA